MTHHFCPTCKRPYGCPRGEEDCGSPQVYDCYRCYLHRYQKEILFLLAAVSSRFGDDQGCAGYADPCFAY